MHTYNAVRFYIAKARLWKSSFHPADRDSPLRIHDGLIRETYRREIAETNQEGRSRCPRGREYCETQES